MRLAMVTRPSPSMPITPAVTPDSTASVNRRRLSIWSLADEQLGALAPELLGHVVEGLAEIAEVALRLLGRNADGEVALRHLLGGVDQPPDGRDQPVGKGDAEPDGGEKDDQRDAEIENAERELDPDPARFERPILGDVLRGHGEMPDDIGRDRPERIDEQVVIAVEHGDAADHAGRPRRDQRWAARFELGLLDRRGRRRREIGLRPLNRLRDDRSVALDEEDAGKAAAARRLGEETLEAVGIVDQEPAGPFELGLEARYLRVERLRLGVDEGRGDIGGVLDDGPGAGREPVVEAPVERHARDHRHEDRRRRCDDAEEGDDPDVEARGGAAPLPGKDQRRDLPADDQDEEEREAPVEDQDREDDRFGRRDRRHAHEDEEGPHGNRQRGHHRDIAAGPHQAGELEAPSAERRAEERRRVDRHPFTGSRKPTRNPPPAVTR